MHDVFLHGLACMLGTRKRMEELDYLDGDKLAILAKSGLRHYCKFPSGMETAIAESIDKTLAASGIARSDIDAVLLVSSSFWKEPFLKTGFSRLLARHGLSKANVMFSSLSECANTAPAMITALSHLECGRAGRILVVLADEHLEERSRIVEPNLTITSDGALSFLLSRDKSGIRVVDAAHLTDSRLVLLDPERDKLEIMRDSIGGMKASLDMILSRNSLRKADITHYFMCNYNTPIQRLHDSVFGFKEGCLVGDTVGEIGHHFSADVFLNLKLHAERAPAGESGIMERYLLLSSGPLSWGAILLEHTLP